MNQDERNRVKKIGKSAYVREEMIRLGFWPPSPKVAEQEATVMAQLRVLYDELAKAQEDVDAITKQIADVGGIEKAIAEIRRKRIERVRAERDTRRSKRAMELTARTERDAVWRRKTLPFLGDGVSEGLNYEGGDAAKTASLGLPALTTASDVAKAIGIPERDLAWLSYHRMASRVDHYNRFTIPKRRGGERVISSPKQRLRVAQSWLLGEILAKLPVHPAAMAFRPGVSIADNAAKHAGKALIIRIDLKDFFPSIGVPRVKGLFRSCGYNEAIATVLALLATDIPRAPITFDGDRKFVAIGKRGAPQGACTSPALANLVCRKMDARLTGAAVKFGFTYTRYADDLVFSHDNGYPSPPTPLPSRERGEEGSKRDSDSQGVALGYGYSAPSGLSTEQGSSPFQGEGWGGVAVGMFLGLVRRIVAETGFVINEEKTSLTRPHQRQTVTGLVVNAVADGDGAPQRISRHDLRRFRAFLHQCDQHGTEEMSKRLGQDALAYAGGYLSFIHMVSPARAAVLAERHPWLVRHRSG